MTKATEETDSGSFASANDVKILELLHEVIELEANALKRLSDSVGESAERAVHLLHGCKGRILVTGIGKSGLICRKIAATFSSLGMPSFFLHPAEALHGDLGKVKHDDVLLACSKSGETAELIRVLQHCRRVGTVIISITGNKLSTVSSQSDCSIILDVGHEVDPWCTVPTTSTTAMLVIGDALAIAASTLGKFTREQFGNLHPGGSIGRMLSIRVSELMHPKSGLPVVKPDTPLQEAVCCMTEARLGAVFVTAESGDLLGIFTDGDLRRLLMKTGTFVDDVIGRVMTYGGQTIPASALAVDAARVMERFAVSVLPVTGAEQEVCGAIHLHDLLRLGIVDASNHD